MIDEVVAVRGPAPEDTEARLTLAITLRSAEERHLWLAFGLFWLANAGLLVALFASGDIPTDIVAYVVCGAGFLLSGVVWIMLRRASVQMRRFGALAELLERRAGVTPELSLVRSVVDDWRVLTLPPLAALVSALLWLVALGLFAYASAVGGLFYTPLA